MDETETGTTDTADIVVEPVTQPSAPPQVATPPTIEEGDPTPISTPDTQHSNILQRPEFSRPEGDENGSTPVVNVGMNVGISNSTSEPQLPTIQVAPVTPPQIVERVVEKVVEKEVIKEVPVDHIVEKIVYRDAEVTDANLRTYLRDFLRRVGPKGRAMQHERALKKRDTVLQLFATHERVSHKLVMNTLKLSDRDASRVLADLTKEGKIILHEPAHHDPTHPSPHSSKPHHGGPSTFYSRSASTTK